MSSAHSFSHLGICVSDLDASLHFYCDGLGFEQGEAFPIDDTFSGALEVGGDVVLTSQFIRKGELSIELLHFSSPSATGEPSRRRNQLGLTHLSFTVDDVDAAAAELVAAGGTELASTRTTGDGIDLVFLSDPDGVRIELMRMGG